MTITFVFASGVVGAVLLAVAVAWYLSEPLRKQLRELCGNSERAEFWTAFANVTIVLTPAIFAMLVDPPMDPGVSLLPGIISQLKWGLIGLVSSVLMLGWILGRFIPKTPPPPPYSATRLPGTAI
jgi:hypothetical protein